MRGTSSGSAVIVMVVVAAGVASAACRPSAPTSSHIAQVDGGAGPAATPSVDAGTAALDAGDLGAEATALLPIPARGQAAESPPSGWCGETAIQEGLLYLGVWAPQREINRAGHPVHPDLYATEIPGALTALGVRFTPYGRGRGYEAFARWAREAIDAGDPVLAGVKLLPTEHPTWGLDHFVLLVGYGPRGLLANTTWGHRAWVAEGAVGISLKEAFYGLRLHGVRQAGRAARARTLEEGTTTVSLEVGCTGPARIELRGERTDREPRGAADAGSSSTAIFRVASDRAAWFSCGP
jgi:hypothetical protein